MRRKGLFTATIAFTTIVLLPAAILAPMTFAQATCGPISTGKECFVSTTGDDTNQGTKAAPFATVARGVSELGPGDILTLREGSYIQEQNLDINGVQGTQAAPIVIRSFPGEHATIDGMVETLDWVPATGPDAHPDEYVSVQTFTGPIRGAFVDSNPYTRLAQYGNLNDFRADNETFQKIPCPNSTGACGDSDPRPGSPRVQLPFGCTPLNCTEASYRYPWVYRGPGIAIPGNPSSTNPQPVHIRLSPTHNNVSGLADYNGATNPNNIDLAISLESVHTMHIRGGSSHIRFENLSIRYGGEPTISIEGSNNITFDHVRIDASSFGVRMGGNASNTTFEHCVFDGGNPSWLFRSDIKTAYTYLNSSGDPINNRGANNTVDNLMVPHAAATNTTIRNCEFVNGHDLSIAGRNLDFHHNWINNMNDEGISLPKTSANVRIHENVITAALDPLSFAVTSSNAPGPFYIYRNLVDVRGPTAGFRPGNTGDTNVWRYGNPFKDATNLDTEWSAFHNTFLVRGEQTQATYPQYRDRLGFTEDRRFFNNIFVAVHPTADDDQAIGFLPWPSSTAEIDGNNYHKIGPGNAPLLRYLDYEHPLGSGTTFTAGSFACISGCTNQLIGSTLFTQSQAQYPPGFEASSIESDPQFMQIGTDGEFRNTDDLRLGSSSPARGAGVALPTDLADLDDDIVPPDTTPDIGLYPFGAPPLEVGVDGSRSYPE